MVGKGYIILLPITELATIVITDIVLIGKFCCIKNYYIDNY